MKFNLRKSLFYVLVFVVFSVLSAVYMVSELQGKVIIANDYVSWRGARQELTTYTETTGEHSWWTGSMFSGMPNYQIGGGSCTALEMMKPLNFITHYGCNQSPMVMLLFYMLGFFALLLAFNVEKKLAAVGAIAMAFSSYFLIIIGASHNTKTASISLMAFVLAGFYCIFNDKKLLGVCLTMFFVAVGFYPHPQMSYYYCFIIGAFFVAELIRHLKTRAWRNFAVSSALFICAFVAGIGTGLSSFFANSEYMTETMRGGHSDYIKASDEGNKTDGLDLDYATSWSYGVDETLTLLVPNFMGGSSHYPVGEKSDLYAKMVKSGVERNAAKQFCQAVPTYWGDQPFTAGPVYVGAVVCFLFVLGLFIVKGVYKWALLAVTLLSIMLSWGHNFMPLTQFFFSVVPMYSKFRAVSSILIIAEVTMPLLGFLALKEVSERTMDKQKLMKSIYISAGITGGLCLLLALFGGSMFDFTTDSDASNFSQLPDWLGALIVDERASMFSSDCWRSFFFIALAAAATWFYTRSEKMSVALLAGIMGVLVMADMWPVDKRFMNDSAFSSSKKLTSYFAKKSYEEEILKDPTHFRVLNLAANTFNEARTSYYFKSIGGYSAAKLRRYQDLIEQHIAPEFSPLYSALGATSGRLELCNGDSLFPVLNMLNAKYFIVPLQNGQEVAITNPHAMGNAWFVESVKNVQTPNEECDALATENLRKVAVVDASKFKLDGANTTADSSATIELTKYTPEYIEYQSSSSSDGVAVFSEIYYPYGWKAYVDGEFKEHFRADYMLRAMNIPAGQHTIRFEFDPDSLAKGDIISVICVLLMYGLLLASIVYYVRGGQKGKETKC